jgi:hypothetical protein
MIPSLSFPQHQRKWRLARQRKEKRVSQENSRDEWRGLLASFGVTRYQVVKSRKLTVGDFERNQDPYNQVFVSHHHSPRF